MGEPLQIGILSETLREKLVRGRTEHVQLARVLNERVKFKILGEFQPKGTAAGKVFVQITPLEGNLQGRVLSVCKDHVIIISAGQKEGSANQPLVEASTP